MISLDAAKTNKEENIYVPENNIRPIENKKAIENKNIPKQWLWQRS